MKARFTKQWRRLWARVTAGFVLAASIWSVFAHPAEPHDSQEYVADSHHPHLDDGPGHGEPSWTPPPPEPPPPGGNSAALQAAQIAHRWHEEQMARYARAAAMINMR